MVAPFLRRQLRPALLELDVERASAVPIARQIVEQLRARIASGELTIGTRLPPSRDFALRLGVARNSVMEAYDELTAIGLLEGRGRQGTVVAAGSALPQAAVTVDQCEPALARRLTAPSATVAAPSRSKKQLLDWRVGQANVQSMPLDVWRAACREAGRHLPPPGYGDPHGEPGLRRAISDWLREHRSVAVDPEQIVVTQGTGQALQLLARALIRPGDLCATEDPGYDGAATAFRLAGGKLQLVGVDEEGVLVDKIERDDQAPAVLHVTLTHQYPLGGRLSGARRRALTTLARRHGMLILENEYDCEFNYAGANHPPLFASAPESAVLLSTFAKAISPALRLGFIVAPRRVAAAVAETVERDRMHVSWPVQKIVETLLVSGEMDRHLRRVRRHYGAMRDAIREKLRRFAPAIRLQGDQGGLHVVIAGVDPDLDLRLRVGLRERGVLFDEVQDFALTAGALPGLLLGYGQMDLAQLEASLKELEQAIRGSKTRRRS